MGWMGWIKYQEKRYSSHNAINLNYVECISLRGYVVLLKTDKVQYELYYADETEARDAYDEILSALHDDRTVALIADPEQAWKRTVEA